MTHRPLALWGVSALAATVMLGGCSGDPKPPQTVTGTRTETTSPSTATPSVTTSTNAPTSSVARDIPAAATKNTSAGAEAFIGFFLEQLNEAWMTPKSSLLDGYCLPTSKTCAAYRRIANDFEAKKWRYGSAPVEVISIEALNKNQVFVTAYQAKATVLNAKGATVQKYQREPSNLLMDLRWSAGQWTIVDIRKAV